MSIPFARAPHIEGAGIPLHSPHAPNAALLIDFDNVTMGMRSDLSKELKTLLASDVIRGKVTVQRAYADWRRYPQYIVPLSEASIDLIFAPAYGSSKKNATDIRMAIDGIELVFTRPEIGTFILLTGDSDFSSLVLKLKEYGKYVIGVGIQESSSDILVQNCDEYYSYTSLSGLRKTDEHGTSATDPWALVERAVEQMGKRSDVMRSDRLKQVMLEIDPNFDEKAIGFNKFSRFVSEAGKKGIIQLQKMENGQYEIVPGRGAKRTEEGRSGGGRSEGGRGEGRRSDRGRSERGRGEGGRSRESEEGRAAPTAPATSGGEAAAAASGPGPVDRGTLAAAYTLLRQGISELLTDEASDSVRDSDVKRRMLALDGAFDEADLGFPKFSRFLQQAQEHGIVELRKGEGGSQQVLLGERTAPPEGAAPATSVTLTSAPTVGTPSTPPPTQSSTGATARTTEAGGAGRLRPREATVGPRGRGDEPPPLLEGQVVARPGRSAPAASGAAASEGTREAIDPAVLRLPSDPKSVVQYLTNSYGGIGEKTAETLVDALGDRLFLVLQSDPAQVERLLPPARAEKLLQGWEADLRRRRERYLGGAGGSGSDPVRSDPVHSEPARSEPVHSEPATPVDVSRTPLEGGPSDGAGSVGVEAAPVDGEGGDDGGRSFLSGFRLPWHRGR